MRAPVSNFNNDWRKITPLEAKQCVSHVWYYGLSVLAFTLENNRSLAEQCWKCCFKRYSASYYLCFFSISRMPLSNEKSRVAVHWGVDSSHLICKCCLLSTKRRTNSLVYISRGETTSTYWKREEAISAVSQPFTKIRTYCLIYKLPISKPMLYRPYSSEVTLAEN